MTITILELHHRLINPSQLVMIVDSSLTSLYEGLMYQVPKSLETREVKYLSSASILTGNAYGI